MNIGLVFNAQKDVSRFAILLDDRRFQHITVFLHRIIRLIFILVLRTKRQSYFCCIQFLQLRRVHNRLSAVNQIVKCICKHSIFFHIGFCDRISQSHWCTPPYISLLSLWFYLTIKRSFYQVLFRSRFLIFRELLCFPIHICYYYHTLTIITFQKGVRS